jgi:hypothetical protein
MKVALNAFGSGKYFLLREEYWKARTFDVRAEYLATVCGEFWRKSLTA